MSTRAIATSTFWQLASQVTMAVLSILTIKFVTMGLSKEFVGNYNSAYGYLQLFGILADFGLYAVAVRETSKVQGMERERVLGALIVIRSGILVLSLGAALIFAWALPVWRGTPLPISITIAALVPFFTLLAGILRTVFQVHYKLHYVFIAEVTQRIVTTATIGAVVLLGLRGSTDARFLYLFLLLGGIGAFVLFVISFRSGSRLMRIRLNVDRVLMGKLFRASAPFGGAFLCVALYRTFDQTVIALLRPDFEIQNAYYGIVVRMVDMGYLIPTFLLNSTLPILSERDVRGGDTRALLGKTFHTILFFGSISALFAVLWARPLIRLLTTDAYVSTATTPGSDTALQLLSLPLLLNGLILYSFYVLLAKNRWKPLVITLLFGAVISLVLNFTLVPSHGFVGAALTSVFVHVVLAVLLLPQGLRAMPMALSRRQGVQWLLFSLSLAAGLFLFRSYLTSGIATLVGLIIATVYMGLLALGLRIWKFVV